MTKKIEEFFNLPPLESTEPEDADLRTSSLISQANDIYAQFSVAEKIDHALPTVVDLEQHDDDMDSIAKKAIQSYQDLVNLGLNVPDVHAGKIYEVAGQMLKTAMEAKNAKADRKLRMIELQLKKMRIDQNEPEAGNRKSSSEFDRNEILKLLVSK